MRSLSRACWRMTVAAAMSTTARRFCPLCPRSRRWSSAGHGRQAHIEQSHGHRINHPRHARGELAHFLRRRPLTAGQGTRQADDDLDRVELAHQRPDPRQVALARWRTSPAGWPGTRTGRSAPRRCARPRGRDPGVRRGALPGPRRAVDLGRHEGQRLVEAGRVGAAALRDVGLAAALAAEQRRRRRGRARRPRRRAPAPARSPPRRPPPCRRPGRSRRRRPARPAAVDRVRRAPVVARHHRRLRPPGARPP